MIQGIYISFGGGVIEARRHDVIANNIANVDTTGFKRDISLLAMKPSIRDVYNLRDAETNPLLEKIGDGVMFAKTSTIQEQGRLIPTGNTLDLAIQGKGFFAVQKIENENEEAKTYYTRDGNFSIDKDGYLVMKGDEKAKVLNNAGEMIKIMPGAELQGAFIQINTNGQITLTNNTDAPIPVGTLGLYDFENPGNDFQKVGQNLYKTFGKAEEARIAASGTIHQGNLEGSNVSGIEEMTNMIETMRLYEANMRFVTMQDQTLQRACNDLGSAPT